jgi:hypothetical protein
LEVKVPDQLSPSPGTPKCVGIAAGQPAIELWNASPAHALSDPAPEPYSGNTKQMKEEALEQWDNERGMTPDKQLTST